MLSSLDFAKKKIVFVFFNEGEKLAVSNDNLIVRDGDGKIKFQCTCYGLFLVFAVGNTSITNVLIQKAQRFGFFIVMMTAGFRTYQIIGAPKDGNTLLHKMQYQYNSLDIGKHIVANKISNQRLQLMSIREKNEFVKEAIQTLAVYERQVETVDTLQEVLAYEGLAAKMYFKNWFNNVLWVGRKPRVKQDYVNATLDIGYSILFSFLDALLSCYGFDTSVAYSIDNFT